MVFLTVLFLLGYSAWMIHGQATICPRISGQPGCVCDHPDGVINLTSIANSGSPRFTGLLEGQYNYDFNPCYTFNSTPCSNVYVCQFETLTPSSSFAIANESEQIVVDPTDTRGQMYLRYTGPGQDGSIPRSTTVYLHCDQSRTTPIATAAGEVDRVINYVFDLYSCAACPGGCVPCSLSCPNGGSCTGWNSTGCETAATPTCRALQRLSESAQFLSCNRNDECNAIHCNVTFGRIQAQLNMVNFTLLPCNLPPTVRLSGIDNSGSVILDRVLSESQNIPLVDVITLNISVLQLTNAIGLEASAIVNPLLTTQTLVILPYTQIPIDTSNCSNINECNIAKGGCEHNCTDTIEGFNCSCDPGYHLDGNGFNCSDIDECESDDLNSCHENANCANTEGGFNCSCNPGYTGDGISCTSLSFGVPILPAVLAPAVVLITITALLCVAVCVVCKIMRQEPTICPLLPLVHDVNPSSCMLSCDSFCKDLRFEIHKILFKNDKVDLTFNPLSPSWTSNSKRLRLSSVVSVFEKLGTIQGAGTHQANDTNNDSKSEIPVADPTMNTLTQNNTTTTAVVVVENDNIVDSFAASTTDQECYDPSTPHSTPDVVSMDQLLVTGNNISPSPPSNATDDMENICVNLDQEEDVQHNISNEADRQNGNTEAELSFSDHDCSDPHSDGHASAVELPTGDHNITVSKQSGEYVSSEDLLRDGFLDLNSHKVESKLELNQQSVSLEVAADPTTNCS